MSTYLKHRDEVKVSVPEATVEDGVTYYHVCMSVGSCTWSVRRRFKDFVELHEKLSTEHGIPKDKLPPKKMIGNKSSKFIEKRREALNEYAAWTLNHLSLVTPTVLTRFLDLHRYDIYFLLQYLAEKLFAEGDSILQSQGTFKCTPLELHAISERLKMPCPSTEKQDKAYDFSHILDFCSQLKNLNIEGTYECIGTSNIVPNSLCFDLVCFKSLENLTILGVPLPRIQGVGTLRETLQTVSVMVAEAVSLNEFLLVDIVHKKPDSIADTVKWKKLKAIDFGSNKVKQIDWAIKLVPELETLALGSNVLSDLSDVSTLHNLTTLDLSCNRFNSCEGWNTKIGNVRSINLSQNQIDSLRGFSLLYSLESLDLCCNLIADIEEVQHICRLPCLQQLWLSANPVATCIDYRVKVLAQFGRRCTDVVLDNERASEKEVDTARVVYALSIAKEGRTPDFLNAHNSTISFNNS